MGVVRVLKLLIGRECWYGEEEWFSSAFSSLFINFSISLTLPPLRSRTTYHRHHIIISIVYLYCSDYVYLS